MNKQANTGRQIEIEVPVDSNMLATQKKAR